MRKKISALVAIAALLMGVAVFAAPTVSEALVIHSITVGNGTVPDYTGGPAGNTWIIAPAGIDLDGSKTVIFTQNEKGLPSTLPTGLPGFNFDTSEHNGAFAALQYTIFINGLPGILDTSISATSGLLNAGGNDVPTSTVNNEAGNWVKLGRFIDPNPADCSSGSCTFDLFVGYADTLHSGACHDQAGPDGLLGPGCLPWSAGDTRWDGVSAGSTAVDFFRGGGTDIPGYAASPHCAVAGPTAALGYCFDGGALMLVAVAPPQVPEPSSLFLLGVGLLGAAAYGRRRLGKKS